MKALRSPCIHPRIHHCLLESSYFGAPYLCIHSPNHTHHHTTPRDQSNIPQSNGGFLGVCRNSLRPSFLSQVNSGTKFCLNRIDLMLINLQAEFGEDMMSGRGFMWVNPPFCVACISG